MAAVAGLLALQLAAASADWPTYMHDFGRSGVTAAGLSFPLAPSWRWRSAAPIEPAWPRPKIVGKERWRNHFDNGNHVAIAGGRVYVGSIAGGRVYVGSIADGRMVALDADTGELVWAFATGAPVRLAPTVDSNRVYVGSDDGFVYCLAAGDGRLLWRFRAGPDSRHVVGNGHVISTWAVRTGVAVADGVAYFGAGVFPQSPVYVIAVDATSGAELWRTETDDIKFGRRTLSPQGYILMGADALFIPSNRQAPFCFARQDGAYRYYAQAGHRRKQYEGVGVYALLYDQRLVSGTMGLLACYEQAGGKVVGTLGGARLVVSADTFYLAGGGGITAVDRARVDEAGALTTKVLKAASRWHVPLADVRAMVLAGDSLMVGSAGAVTGLAAATGEQRWHASLSAAATGLAIADERLFVSTSRGDVITFAADPAASVPAATVAPAPPSAGAAARVSQIVARLPGDRGRAVIIGEPPPELLPALVAGTALQVHCLVPAGAAAATRAASIDRGSYGTRVWVDTLPTAPGGRLPLPSYMANLLVVVDAGQGVGLAAECLRVLRPWGGVAVSWTAATAAAGAPLLSGMRTAAAAAAESLTAVGADVLVRGPLPGAGSWTHQYATPGNTAASGDQRVTASLRVLWYGDPGTATQTDRHHKVPAPLVMDGRAYLQQEEVVQPGRKRGHHYVGRVTRNYVLCLDVFNGTQYWRREVPGAYRIRLRYGVSNLALSEAGLFVAAGDRCLQLDRMDGHTRQTFTVPMAPDNEPRLWAYVGVVGTTLVGSSARENVTTWLAPEAAQYSDAVFGCDITTGQVKWHHQGQSIRKNSIALGEDAVFLADAGELTEEKLENRRVGYA
jgi:outer membrane protein assembly factor BamB